MNLRGKITWSILLLILFFGSLASISTYYLTKKEFTTQVTKDLHNNAIALSHELYQIMRQSRDIAKALANDSLVKEYVTTTKPSSAQAEVMLDEFKDYNLGEMYSAIYILDKDGIAQISTDPRFLGQNYSFRNYFKSSIAGNDFVTTAIGVTSKELGYYFSSPIRSNLDDTILGVLVVKLKTEHVERALRNHVSAGYEILLSDHYGIIILPSDSTKYLHSLGSLPPDSQAELASTQAYATAEFEKLDYDVLMDIINQGFDSSKIIEIQDVHDNRDEIVAIGKVEDFPYYIIFEGDMNIIDKVSIRASAVIAAFVLVAAILSVIIILIVVEVFLRQQQRTEQKLLEKTTDLERLNKLMVGRELKMIELKKEITSK
jgi:C4-dicarboxylate-specific signal transduction histidine kinase